ncbi:MAG: hypothetical protein M1838_002927 [Thelocarpon superellum]|nr:MAG: hypothetical protein M1838_002927 [Thelocarpon superellum]
MSTQTPPSDSTNASGGLHNLLTGLTAQSPGLGPLSDPASSTTSLAESTSSNLVPPTTLFNTPSRSILSSGNPTSSISANTAHASLSAATSSSASHPLSTLSSSMPLSSTPRRTPRAPAAVPVTPERTRTVITAAKEVDDPSMPADPRAGAGPSGSLTPVELTRLFASTSVVAPSRTPSSNRTPSGGTYTRASFETVPSLPNHLWNRGFLDGRHSDITVHAFSTSYALHRILLDRAPFFSSALSEPWFESTAKAIELNPEEIDSNITQRSFELALKHLYGLSSPLEEEEEAVGLFATASWLEMADLIQSSSDVLLRRLRAGTVSDLIKLVTSNYYGQAGERILTAAKAMLYREGWEMSPRAWDGIPADMVRDIVGGDGFFVPEEWERYRLAKKLFLRRLRDSTLADSLPVIDEMLPRDGRDSRLRLSLNQASFGKKADRAPSVYDHPEVVPMVDLLEDGIHYLHLSFEQLLSIRQDRDEYGRSLVSDQTITNALWLSMELRRKVVNASETDPELGLRVASSSGKTRESASAEDGSDDAGKLPEEDPADADAVSHASTVEQQAARRFWIPSIDSTKVVGDDTDLISGRFSTTTRRGLELTTHSNPRTSTAPPASSENPASSSSDTANVDLPRAQYFTPYPPYRFSVEFPNPRLLKDKKRVYSRTVEYLGSHWNIYVQKIRSSKNVQLGVYLHRAKIRDAEEMMRGATGPRSVDEAIGQLEREMLLRRTERRLRRQQQYEAQLEGEEESSSGGENPGLRVDSQPRPANRTGATASAKGTQNPTLTLSSLPEHSFHPSGNGSPEGDDDHETTTSIPTIPQYIDGRPTIKTYFKIYSPTKGGLSVYESAPDGFNFSQSWGWRSSMILDDDASSSNESEGTRSRDGRLRFSVVLGNV